MSTTEILTDPDVDEGPHEPRSVPVPTEALDPPELIEIQPEPGKAVALERHTGTPLVPGLDIPIIPALDEMRGLAALAVTLAGADAVPQALRNKPNDVFQIALTARDLGVAVTTALREFHVIDGKVTLSPKVKLAMVRERGKREGWKVWPDPANDAEQAVWYATRADMPGLTFSSEFTMAEAREIKNGSRGMLADKENWKGYPKRMLSWRALGYLLDDIFPEVGTGLYSPDELGAMTDQEGNAVIDVASTEPLPGHRAPRGHKAGGAAADPSEQLLRDAEPDTSKAILDRKVAIMNASEAASHALIELWRAGDDPLPNPASLQVRHKARALGKLASIEARLQRGDFGDIPEADARTHADGCDLPADHEGECPDPGRPFDEAPQPAQEPAQEATAAVTPDDAPTADSDDQGDQEGGSTPERRARAAAILAEDQARIAEREAEARLERVVARVKGLTKPELVTQLQTAQLATNGNEDTLRRRLAQHLLDTGE